ncbi:TrmH family RNA methyltransferase [Tissierella creatinophila]|uniref:23S rRNA (Guanosine-2'-O-)-methyltransferase RlmB n=1 Tax=Tissierella creatinophila DSM 6911 TaxID=1123403 RepID=A0A1U7M6B8_TISCR|nr:RNA methyltransferase [Tissierella creatinophila]OLS02831.1 23S rRNA (guanosine-2'-O-)-methyltransferase RlmB [Tissierella creatinophila DSM 6911]
MIEITSDKNPIIKEIKALSRKKNRWREKLFIIEGIKVIEEAIKASMGIKYIFFSEILLEADGGEVFFNKIKDRKETVKLSTKIFNQITNLDSPQGVLAIVEFKEREITDLYKKELPFIIFLDGLNDPGNLGTIIRTADAFRVDAIVLGEDCVDPYNSKVVRSTMGSIFRVSLYNVKDNEDFFDNMKKRDIDIITTSLSGKPLERKDFSGGFVLVIGNEANGVRKNIIERSTKEIKIPMPGGAESLNAGVAASIIMYEAMMNRN